MEGGETVSTTFKKYIWISWFLLWPTTVILIYIFFPPIFHTKFIDLILLGSLMVVMGLFHFQVRGTDIIASIGVSMAVFLLFGLFIEMLLMQLSIIAFLLAKRLHRDDYYRFPINSLMFLFVSVASGLFYYLINGQIGTLTPQEYPHLVPITAYVFAIFFFNHLFLFIFRRLIFHEGKFISMDMAWEALTTALITPFGIVLYVLYSELGTMAIYIVAIPTITISFIFRLINSSYKTNHLLQKTNQIGQQLTEKLEVEHILDLFFNQIDKMLDPDFAYILDIDQEGRLFVTRLYEKDPGSLYKQSSLSPEGVSWKVVRIGKSFKADNRGQWRHLSKGFLPISAQTILSVPMKRNNGVVGVITLVSKKKRAYKNNQLMVMEILANFLAVAIENARDYEKTKDESERDPLTNLFNYRHFAKLLNKQFQSDEQSPFSVVMLDLDHFKTINDTYGHESGNMVLKQVASLLQSLIDEDGVVARYGGEEFIILLPHHNRTSALHTAEMIRTKMAEESFTVELLRGDLSHQKIINVTASIGVATAPDQGEDMISLVRNADRALYTGAKQQGRNRVAGYIG